MTYSHTRWACYTGLITQAIVVNLAPVLFIIFQTDYDLSYEKLATLIVINFTTQIIVDFLSIKLINSLGYRAPAIISHACAVVGLVLLGILPNLLSSAFVGLCIATIIFAVGGGLLEVLVSPMIESIPTPEEQKTAQMSLLHSFYCWGQVMVVLFTTLVLFFVGTSRWYLIPMLWAVIPFVNMIMFAKVPLPEILSSGERVSIAKLFCSPIFLLAIVLMVCTGAGEQTISQWSSLFAEQGLGLSKVFGDLAGPCLFAVMMGVGRTLYGAFGAKLRPVRTMVLCCSVCSLSYLLVALSPSAFFSLVGCALSGLSVSIMWPGVYSLTSSKIPRGGTALFGMLAVFGDIGCSAGPFVAGVVADKVAIGSGIFARLSSILFSGQAISGLKTGILVTAIFPLVAIFALIAFSYVASRVES